MGRGSDRPHVLLFTRGACYHGDAPSNTTTLALIEQLRFHRGHRLLKRLILGALGHHLLGRGLELLGLTLHELLRQGRPALGR